MPDKNEETIFEAAVELQDPAARARFVAQACGDDLKLRREVEALLRSHDSRSLLDVPVFDLAVGANDHSPLPMEAPGTVIGRYKLLETIGEGGMAVVYMAEQTEPIRRKVALKIIKLGMDTRQVIARFEAERQALALMDHPCIAKVLDAGATETGRPYFAMELVTGVSITEYCDKNSLSTKDRLTLFLQVCNAVQHAHQKGIIHRDIKPSNVMVTHHDGKPVPKVIDFGIAKATNQKLTEKTLFTRYAHIIGTPAYMSPEQAELSELDIDTRSDIYSLGVLLYELLTGTTPFSEEELRKAGYIEMQRVIREQEPVKPSTKLSTLGDTLTDIAKRRSCTPDLLRKAIRGDLDWIVMRSLEKDRARRYETAGNLAEDVRRHLEHEPVLARGPSTTYRLRKFLRRHRVQVLVGLTVAALLAVVAVILSIWNEDRLQWERDRLHLAQAEELREQALLSQAQGQYASGERDVALETIQPILDSPHVGGKARLLRAGILADNRRFDEATAILTTLLDGRPEIAGAAHALLARILRESGNLDAQKLREMAKHRRQAETLLPKTAEAYFLQAMTALTVKEQLGALHQAVQLASRDEDFRNPVHYESLRLRAFTYYASRKYDEMKDDALGMMFLRRRDPLGHWLRAVALRELGKYDEAIEEYDGTLALAKKEDPQYPDWVAQRSEVLLRMGHHADVLAVAQDACRLWPDRPVFQYHVFCALAALGEYDQAEAIFQGVVHSAPIARNGFWLWVTEYVFDTLDAGRSWHLPEREPTGAAFLPLVEAEETYRDLSAKARRIISGGFGAQWSPDGKKLAFSLGVRGYSGVATFDPSTKETDLLIVPGKDPRWSPDGRHIAFVRDCQALRSEELTATERKDQARWATDEEVWLMKSDGTEARRLARGGWPSWSKDSTQVYYHSRLDGTLNLISIAGPVVEPKRIMACPSNFPSVSPDNRRVAYLDDVSLQVRDLVSQATVAEWRVPLDTWGGPAWSPTGQELCLGAGGNVGDRTGLWIYRLDSKEPTKILSSQVMAASWAPDGAKLVFGLRPPYFELWIADVDPAVPTAQALGPGQTLEEHWRQMLRLYLRRIEADPRDAYTYADRARYYDYSHKQMNVEADMRRWSAIIRDQSAPDSRRKAPRGLSRVLNLPFDCELVFSAERPVNEISMMSIAFGQKGRCEMKLFEMPMVVTSLLGFCLLSGLETPTAHGDFAVGKAVDLGPPVNSTGNECVPCISADGLELYFQREEPLGEIYVARRPTPDSTWGEPVKLGPAINTSDYEGGACISADGLSLYFCRASGGIFVTRRATTKDDWGTPVNLGPVVNKGLTFGASVSADELELYFHSDRAGGYGGASDIWVTIRPTVNDNWGTPVNLGPTINSPSTDNWPGISSDGLALFFSSTRPGGFGSWDIYVSRRATKKDPWGPPVNLGPLANSAAADVNPKVSFDGSTLYFCLYPRGIWQAPIAPAVDFNADGKVDLVDLVMLIDNWGTNKTLCDIGPMPWGDGKVDIEDLKVFMTYYEKENPPKQ